MSKRIATQIAEHFGFDIDEIKEYEYQPGFFTRKVYAGFDENRLWSAGKTPPRRADGWPSEYVWKRVPSAWPNNPDLWMSEF